MKTLAALAIAGGAVVGYMLVTRKGGFLANVASKDTQGAPATAQQPSSLALLQGQNPGGVVTLAGARLLRPTAAQTLAQAATPPPGNAPTPTSGSIGAKDIGAGIGAAGGVAACAAISSGIGTAAAPLCGAAGGYLGGKAVEGGQYLGSKIEDGANAVGSWVKGLF